MNYYSFSAIRGTQSGQPFYTVMVPLSQVPRIFCFDDTSLPAELRSQRVLSKARVPQIATYIANNPDNYILSSLCACVDGEMSFRSASNASELRNVGILTIPMEARILLNDGQHRRAAIERAINLKPELENESVSVVLFCDLGLERSQQMFADLNKNAVRPSGSLNVLYDHRDPLAKLSAHVLSEIEFFGRFTDLEHSSLSNKSPSLYTLSSLNQANGWLADREADRFGNETRAIVVEYWREVFENMRDWHELQACTVKAHELRQKKVHAHGVILQGFGLLGARLILEKPKKWHTLLKKLGEIDWSRTNSTVWEKRVMNGKRMNGQSRSVLLGANVLYRSVGLELDERGRTAEESLSKESSID